jgi:hypothetical protein
VILLLLLIGSLLMISLGLIGLYLARIYDEVKRRPRFVVAETIGALNSRLNGDSLLADNTSVEGCRSAVVIRDHSS